jgi:hypothetical protein
MRFGVKTIETQIGSKASLAGSCVAVTMLDEFWAHRILSTDRIPSPSRVSEVRSPLRRWSRANVRLRLRKSSRAKGRIDDRLRWRRQPCRKDHAQRDNAIPGRPMKPDWVRAGRRGTSKRHRIASLVTRSFLEAGRLAALDLDDLANTSARARCATRT